MNPTRRDLSLLLPALMAATTAEAASTPLPSNGYEFSKLPVNKNAKTGAESRQVFDGVIRTGFHIDMHITTMPPGQMPHPPHHHEHEEMMMIKEGELEATVEGKVFHLGPGSIFYVKSNEEHGVKSVGSVAATYFVLALGATKKA